MYLSYFVVLVYFVDVVLVLLMWVNDVFYCVKKDMYYNNVFKGGLEVGDYMFWELVDVSYMIVDKCIEYCCES